MPDRDWPNTLSAAAAALAAAVAEGHAKRAFDMSEFAHSPLGNVAIGTGIGGAAGLGLGMLDRRHRSPLGHAMTGAMLGALGGGGVAAYNSPVVQKGLNGVSPDTQANAQAQKEYAHLHKGYFGRAYEQANDWVSSQFGTGPENAEDAPPKLKISKDPTVASQQRAAVHDERLQAGNAVTNVVKGVGTEVLGKPLGIAADSTYGELMRGNRFGAAGGVAGGAGGALYLRRYADSRPERQFQSVLSKMTASERRAPEIIAAEEAIRGAQPDRLHPWRSPGSRSLQGLLAAPRPAPLAAPTAGMTPAAITAAEDAWNAENAAYTTARELGSHLRSAPSSVGRLGNSRMGTAARVGLSLLAPALGATAFNQVPKIWGQHPNYGE